MAHSCYNAVGHECIAVVPRRSLLAAMTTVTYKLDNLEAALVAACQPVTACMQVSW